ncbi:MAG: hypothetical protein PHT51_00610 [Patescibacteria group bacterium]|nr:hypothetical protein [Patescibacteria group bacterium]MDD4610729.1 hypothetical protein [Patescibacteria group bacterium]
MARKKSKLIYVFVLLFALLFMQAVCVNAKPKTSQSDPTVSSLLDEIGTSAQYDTGQKDLSILVGNVIKIFLSLLGVFFVVLTIYAGFLWMTARGDAEQVKKAQTLVTNAIIGLIIVVSAYAITYFVTYSITNSINTQTRGFN